MESLTSFGVLFSSVLLAASIGYLLGQGRRPVRHLDTIVRMLQELRGPTPTANDPAREWVRPSDDLDPRELEVVRVNARRLEREDPTGVAASVLANFSDGSLAFRRILLHQRARARFLERDWEGSRLDYELVCRMGGDDAEALVQLAETLACLDLDEELFEVARRLLALRGDPLRTHTIERIIDDARTDRQTAAP